VVIRGEKQRRKAPRCCAALCAPMHGHGVIIVTRCDMPSRRLGDTMAMKRNGTLSNAAPSCVIARVVVTRVDDASATGYVDTR